MRKIKDINLTIEFDKYNFGEVSEAFSKKCHYMTACYLDNSPYIQYDLNEMIRVSNNDSFYLNKHYNLNEKNKKIRDKMNDEFEEFFRTWSYDDGANPYPDKIVFTENFNKDFDPEELRKSYF